MTDVTVSPSMAPAASPPPPPPPLPAAQTPAPQTLDELMMAMDVVDTLRHQEKLVQTELGQQARDEDLKKRLRELYESQGLAVTDGILEQGIRALKESRFTYEPPKPSWGLTFAKIWVRRTVVGTWSAGALAALGLSWGTYYFGFVSPQKAEAERTQVELSTTLPREIEDAYVRVVNLARTGEGQRQAGALRADGMFAIGRKDVAGAKRVMAQIETLRQTLTLEYEIRIVASNPSGVERIPPNGSERNNYYVIVQAVGSNGRPIPMDVTSEENGKTRKVEMWGVRVSPEQYQAVRRDKRDNGIIDGAVVGAKKSGFLEPEYDFSRVQRGFITEW
jgi:Family of unknown function (DUF6384)